MTYRSDSLEPILPSPCCGAESHFEYEGGGWVCWGCAKPIAPPADPSIETIKEKIWSITQNLDYINESKARVGFVNGVELEVGEWICYWRLYEQILHDYEWNHITA